MITKNFRLNALANKYASALYNHIIGVYAHRTRYDNVLCGYTNHMYLV